MKGMIPIYTTRPYGVQEQTGTVPRPLGNGVGSVEAGSRQHRWLERIRFGRAGTESHLDKTIQTQ